MTVAVTPTNVVRGTFTGDIKIASGGPLYRVSSKAKYKACSSRGPCALDDDGDGTSDRIALDETVAALELKAPVAYEARDAVVPGSNGNSKEIITYLGVNGDVPRLSYREFLNDLARPAFTEELAIPLGKTFPPPVGFSNTKLTILCIDAAGIRYRVGR